MIIASCGHTLTSKEGLGYAIAIKDQTREGHKAISYLNVCTKCKKFYEKKKLIISPDKIDEYLGVDMRKPDKTSNKGKTQWWKHLKWMKRVVHKAARAFWKQELK